MERKSGRNYPNFVDTVDTTPDIQEWLCIKCGKRKGTHCPEGSVYKKLCEQCFIEDYEQLKEEP